MISTFQAIVGCCIVICGVEGNTTQYTRREPATYEFKLSALGVDQDAAHDLLKESLATNLESLLRDLPSPATRLFNYERYRNGVLEYVGRRRDDKRMIDPFAVPKSSMEEIVAMLQKGCNLATLQKEIGTPSYPGYSFALTHRWRLWKQESPLRAASPVWVTVYFEQKDFGPGKKRDPEKLQMVGFVIHGGEPTE